MAGIFKQYWAGTSRSRTNKMIYLKKKEKEKKLLQSSFLYLIAIIFLPSSIIMTPWMLSAFD